MGRTDFDSVHINSNKCFVIGLSYRFLDIREYIEKLCSCPHFLKCQKNNEMLTGNGLSCTQSCNGYSLINNNGGHQAKVR